MGLEDAFCFDVGDLARKHGGLLIILRGRVVLEDKFRVNLGGLARKERGLLSFACLKPVVGKGGGFSPFASCP